MIKINLIPQNLKAKKASQAPLLLVAVLIIAGVFIFILYTYQSARISSVRNKINTLKQQKAELEPKVRDMQNLIAELENKDKAISELAGQERFLWSKKLNELSDLVPDNIKFTHVFMTNKDNQRVFHLEGVAYSRNGEERVALVGKLMDALKSKGFYNKANGSPNFGEINFIQTVADKDNDKNTGFQIGNFIIEMQII